MLNRVAWDGGRAWRFSPRQKTGGTGGAVEIASAERPLPVAGEEDLCVSPAVTGCPAAGRTSGLVLGRSFLLDENALLENLGHLDADVFDDLLNLINGSRVAFLVALQALTAALH